MRKLKTHTFNGRKYRIDIMDYHVDGVCDQYKPKRMMMLCADLKTRMGLITVVHEALHAENWCKDEQTIDNVSKEIGTFLWRLGYRRKV